MRATPIVALIAGAVVLGGCHPRATADAVAGQHGRFQGIGLYAPGQMWAQLAGETAPRTSAAARLSDDDEVIVVVDTKTGEVRQCGDLSGYCVTMNPWTQPVAQARAAPVSLVKHADELARPAQAAETRP